MKPCGLFIVPSNSLESVQTRDNCHKRILSLLLSSFLAFIKRSRIVLKKAEGEDRGKREMEFKYEDQVGKHC